MHAVKTIPVTHFTTIWVAFFITLLFQSCSLTATTIKTSSLTSEEARLTEQNLDLLVSWVVGKWDNIAQIKEQISQGIPEEERRKRYAMTYNGIVAPRVKGRLIAIENYDDGRGFEGSMERVSLHRFMLSENNDAIIHEILLIKDKAFRKSLIGNLSPLKHITENDFKSKKECRLYWQWTGERFEGVTKKRGLCNQFIY
jgi:hypothetical protein